MLFLDIINNSPIIITFSSLLLFIYFQSFFFLVMFILQFIGIYINKFLKEYIFKPIYMIHGKKIDEGISLPLLFIGNRPLGSSCCDAIFKCSEKISKTFGMPSGHAQSIGIFTSMVLLFWYNNNKKIGKIGKLTKMINERWGWLLIIFILILGIFYTRVYYTGCHTIQQVLVGFLVGIGIGYLGYDIYVKMGETFFLEEKTI